MRLFGTEVAIAAPPALVWAVMCDVERWSEWTSTVSRIRLLDHGPLALGSRALVHQPRLRPATWRVTELDERARRFTWVMCGPGVAVTARHAVELAGAGSRVTLSIAFSGMLGGLVARLTRGMNERYLETEAQGLKARCEGAAR